MAPEVINYSLGYKHDLFLIRTCIDNTNTRIKIILNLNLKIETLLQRTKKIRNHLLKYLQLIT